MKTHIERWGSSFVLRIPEDVAVALGLKPNQSVELQVDGATIVIRPALESSYDLNTLLALITDENRHEVIDSGKSMGEESL